MPTFADTLAALARAGVEFVVVGGLAVAQAGFVRVTDDVDLLVEASPANLSALIAALADRADGAVGALTPADFPVEEGCVRIADEYDIDVFTVMGGRLFSDLADDTDWHDVQGERVRFLSAAALVALKAASLRPKDQHDAAVLRDLLSRRSDA